MRRTGGAELDLDLGCFFFGDIAYTEGDADGEEVANDFYIRNLNSAVRVVPVAADAIVYAITSPPDADLSFVATTLELWPTIEAHSLNTCPEDPFCGVWLYVNRGVVTEIVEQYVP